MIARSMTLVARVTRSWVTIYTVGLREDVKCARRDEIESDLWEQEVNRIPNGESLARILLGVPDDVLWRLEQRSADAGGVRTRKGKGMIATTSERAFIGGAWLMAAFTVLIAVAVAFGFGEPDVAGVDIPRPLWAILGIAIGALILSGVRALDTSPALGGILVLLGALPMAAILVWSVLLPAVWLLLAVLLVLRALMLGRESNGGAPA